MHKFFGKKSSTDEDKTKVELVHKFKLGQHFVPKRLDSNTLPPLKTIVEFPGVDPVALDALRQQQKALRLFDAAGYLYDPKTKQWVAPNWHVPGLHDNLNYFVDWPEMLKGLPAGAERVNDADDCEESAVGEVFVDAVGVSAQKTVNSSAFYQLEPDEASMAQQWKWGDIIEPSAQMAEFYRNKKPEKAVITELPLLTLESGYSTADVLSLLESRFAKI